MKDMLFCRWASAMVGCAACATSSFAGAQAAEPQKLASAQSLFDQAMTALDQKDYATACPKLEEVTRILPEGVGGYLALAQCYEEEGRLASAWTTYLTAATTAANAHRPEEERQAREAAGLLGPKLARITVSIPAVSRGLPDLKIERDGVKVDSAQWGVPMPVDKGTHVISASASNKQRWQRYVDIAADGVNITVDVAELADTKSAPLSPPILIPPKPARNLTPSSSRSGLRVSGTVLTGTGVAGIGIGAVFGIMAISKRDESNNGPCVGNRCSEMGKQLRSDGLLAAGVSTGMFIVGSAALASGVALLVIARRTPPPTSAHLNVGAGMLSISGVW